MHESLEEIAERQTFFMSPVLRHFSGHWGTWTSLRTLKFPLYFPSTSCTHSFELLRASVNNLLIMTMTNIYQISFTCQNFLLTNSFYPSCNSQNEKYCYYLHFFSSTSKEQREVNFSEIIELVRSRARL